MASELWKDSNRGRLRDDVVGFSVDAPDGPVGKVERVDDERARMVATTRRWPVRRRNALPASAVVSVDRERRVVYVRTSKRDILRWPPYDGGAG